MRGYFGIGIYRAKTEANVGTLWRSANCLGASFIFTVGKRYAKRQSTDTMDTPRHIPLYSYETFEAMRDGLPRGCKLVGIEQTPTSLDVASLAAHPERAAYILGAEDDGLPAEVLEKCEAVVHINSHRCINVAVAGSIVMYDRIRRTKKAGT